MSLPKSILITSASGKIGRHLVPLLLAQSPQPTLVLPTRNAENLKSALPSISKAEQNVVLPEGSVKDPLWVESLLKDNKVDTVFLCLTGIDEMSTALLCLDAIRRVPTVKNLIYLSSIGDFTSETGFKEAVRTRPIPRQLAKAVVEQRLLHGPFEFKWTVLGPTVFFANDYMQKTNIMAKGELAGLSPHGISRIALSDIAIAARNAMYDTTGTWHRKKVQLGTKKLYTGAEFAEIWSKALGKPVKGVYITPEGAAEAEQLLRRVIPGDAGLDLARSQRLLFESLLASGISMTDAEYQDQIKLLGKEPDRFESWVEETARIWLQE
ncbi:NAD(P)-binding protein [Karstenula rhodostoma CBS 690.94]|uniref:NAD(P)-binding protein n=1 Tax=Karstenula rhodostoma CBS 690.94 TaxID=1392251 RepID=A0A9P4PUI4_9PLEO|nr:NAD(P)-binding protein [Karstenula rhodostoma CBS 690.94]